MIRIIDPEFHLLGEIDDYESLIFTKRYDTFGEFQLTINKDKKNTAMLKRGCIIFIDNTRAGIIDHRGPYREANGGGGETLNLMGYTLERLLNYRVTEPPPGEDTWRMTNPAETVIKALINYNLGPGANKPERIIPEVIIAPDQQRGVEATWETEYRPLDEDVQKLCRQTGLGIITYLDFSRRKIIVDTIEGRDLTVGQRIYPPVIFSTEFDNLMEQQLTDSTMDYRSTALVCSKGEGKNRCYITLHGELTGLDRREVFVNARDVVQSDVDKLSERGDEALAAAAPIFTLDGKINPRNTMLYGKDYALGDIVTMRHDETVLHTRITEVTETWDENGYAMTCVFGEKAPDLIGKLKQAVNQITS